MIRTPALFWAVLLYSFILGHFPALFLVVLLYIFITNNSALFPAVLLFSIIPGHFKFFFIPYCVRLPVDHCLDHNKGSYDNTGIVYTGIWDRRVLGWQRL